MQAAQYLTDAIIAVSLVAATISVAVFFFRVGRRAMNQL